LEDSPDTSEMFSMLLAKKLKMEKEVSKYYEIVQKTTFQLIPLTQCH
jgi:nucleoside recognition membrane protein YjiH